MSCSYILEINPLSFASFANIFSHLRVVFLFMDLFVVQKLLGLIRSHLFVFIFITLRGGSKSSHCKLYQRVFCLCFSPRVS